MIIDAWAQHPTLRLFTSLRRWAKDTTLASTEIPVAVSLAAMDQAGVNVSLISAWMGPDKAMITNDEVADFAACLLRL